MFKINVEQNSNYIQMFVRNMFHILLNFQQDIIPLIN